MESAEIRRRFLDFFERRGHTVLPSASLLLDDPTLLFVNAGMVPFKPYFLGHEQPPASRLASVQKVVRTLDIDEVGKDSRHATFFQMNGNFSFGDYFKEQAIPFAWELLTSSVQDGGFGLDPQRLWATVYHDDDEAHDIWLRSTGIPQERIQRRGKADNFWSMGVPGPCGPDSEIYYDRGPQYGRDGGPDADEERYLEIWNLVFMQYVRGEGTGKDDYEILGDLPARNIDTGMGLERMATLLQGVETLYEIDTTAKVLRRASELSGQPYGAEHGPDVSLRIVADHARTAVMLIGDGVTPGNEGRGYVLRRMMRRTIRNMRLLGAQDPTMRELVDASIAAMAPSYPELESMRQRIEGISAAEEQAFLSTLRSGTQIFDVAAQETKDSGRDTISGSDAFKLHDTYGFPIDLTLEMAAEQGLVVDRDAFTTLMSEQRQRAKADSQAKKAGYADVSIYRDVLERHGATEWLAYDTLHSEATALELVGESTHEPAQAGRPGEIVRVVLDRTPFYAESGGQNADAGTLSWDGGSAEVLDVQRPVKGLVVHQVRVLTGELTAGRRLSAQVDEDWRLGACQAHSGTHVVHAALREVLGPNALQSGSYNRPGYLRLDFAWSGGLQRDQVAAVEQVANRALRSDLAVRALWMTLPEARDFGALALFGETYGEQVRVVEIGGPWSRELCGGTHVRRSSQIGTVVVTSDSSIGSGVRRIEALTGIEGFGYLAKERDLVGQLSTLVKGARREELPARIEAMVMRTRELERELDKLRSGAVLDAAAGLAAAPQDIDGLAFVAHQAPEGTGADDLRKLVLEVRGRLGERPAVVVGSAAAGGRPVVVVATNDAARQHGHRAGALVRIAAQVLGGGGGGKDDVAQGGGTDAARIGEALAELERSLRQG